jgi:DNA-binding NtrC family response regulator
VQSRAEPIATELAEKRLVLVCGPEGDLTARVVEDLGNVTGWSVRGPDATPTPDLRDVALIVLVGAEAEPPGEVLFAHLTSRAPACTLIAIGPIPALALQARSWFRTPPSPQAWVSLLEDLFPARDPERAGRVRWRRKADMLIGSSPRVREVLHTIDRVASATLPILVTGESGTGKEIVARALHYTGPRRDGPFITVNCAAVPEALFEAELFGHQRGAFTGAVTDRVGAFESAQHGTLFLDEIGELPLLLQPKLLRAVQTSEVTPIGTSAPRIVDVRLVAATNRDLTKDMQEGRFREDLYYRLSVFPIALPPLRERIEDVAALTHHHLRIIAEREKRPVPRLTQGALRNLMQYEWPGNVRELINALEYAFVLATDGVIDAVHLALGAGQRAENVIPYRDAKIDFDRRYFSTAMRLAGGNVSTAARITGKTRKEIYEALRRVGLTVTDYRTSAPLPVDDGRSER